MRSSRNLRLELLARWEQLRAPYVVVAQLAEPVKYLLHGGLVWSPTELAGTDVAEIEYQTLGWPAPAPVDFDPAPRGRAARNRRQKADRRARPTVPGPRHEPARERTALAVWRYYNGRAGCENVIKELQQGEALTTLCLRSFWPTEAALTYNLTVLFQRHLGWQTRLTVSTLPFRLFMTPGILAHRAGKTTIKLAIPPSERDWWRRLREKILSPFPNYHAVENIPAFAS